MLPRQRSTHIVRKISRQPAFKWKCVPDRNHFYFITFLDVHGLYLSSLLLWHIKAHPSVSELSYSVLNHTEYLPGFIYFTFTRCRLIFVLSYSHHSSFSDTTFWNFQVDFVPICSSSNFHNQIVPHSRHQLELNAYLSIYISYSKQVFFSH